MADVPKWQDLSTQSHYAVSFAAAVDAFAFRKFHCCLINPQNIIQIGLQLFKM